MLVSMAIARFTGYFPPKKFHSICLYPLFCRESGEILCCKMSICSQPDISVQCRRFKKYSACGDPNGWPDW